MPSPHQMRGLPSKPFHNTQNDNTKHLKIRRRGLRFRIQSSVKKARTNPQPGNKTGTGSVCSLSHRERSMRSRGINTRQHENLEYNNHSYQQPKSQKIA
jgi:hypothetical protein